MRMFFVRLFGRREKIGEQHVVMEFCDRLYLVKGKANIHIKIGVDFPGA